MKISHSVQMGFTYLACTVWYNLVDAFGIWIQDNIIKEL